LNIPIKFFIAMVLAFTPLLASAQRNLKMLVPPREVVYANGQKEMVGLGMDINSPRRVGDHVEAWWMEMYLEAGLHDLDLVPFEEKYTVVEINCKHGTVGVAAMMLTDGLFQPVYKHKFVPIEMVVPPKDTDMGVLLKASCRFFKKHPPKAGVSVLDHLDDKDGPVPLGERRPT